MKKNLFFTLLISMCTLVVSGQRNSNQTIKIAPKFIKLEESVPSSLKSQIFKSQFELKAEDKLVLIKSQTDEIDMTHHKYQQEYKQIPIEGANYILHEKNGQIISLNGDFRYIKDFDVQVQIDETTALEKAKTHLGNATFSWESKEVVHPEHDHGQYKKPEGNLIILTKKNGVNETTLAYKFDIFTTEPLKRSFIYVNAKTGEIALEINRIQCNDTPVTGNSLYNGNINMTGDFTGSNYRLRQTSSGNGIETYDLNNGTNYNNASDITSNSANFTGNSTGVQAHYGAEQTHSYYMTKHNRNSYNGTGGVIKSYVSYSSNYVNAFWNGSVMTYGDGDGVNYGPLVSLDIVGHEITHGVTEYSANLVYSYESGALNESFSDIFGESIENYGQGTNDWLMGDQIGAGGSGGALRNMANPNQYGDPDTYLGTNWVTGSSDNGGVHTNSGVQNKWFYILSVGESGTNDNGDTYNVTGLGMDVAAAIAYRSLTTYLTSNSQFADARTGAIQSAIDLYGAGSTEEIATTNAWYAVGVGSEYGNVSYCNSQGNTFNEEYIARVQLNTIDNATGITAGYSDHTNISTDLDKNTTYTITVTPEWPGSTYSEGYSVWIDYNQNTVFESSEQVFSQSPTTATPVSGSFTVPSSATDGATRMRVSLKYNGIPSSCEVFSYGEVEDYTVVIGNGNGGGDTQAPTTPTALTASNTTQTTTDLSWNASSDNVGVTGYNVYIDGNLDGTTSNTNYSITGLTASTTYSMSVEAFDAAGNTSGQASTNVTTNAPAGDTQAPTTPTALTASNTTQTTTDLSWNASSDNVGVTGYNVYIDGNLDGTTSNTNYSITGLTASTTYSMSVEAFDAAGNTSGQASTNVTTNAPAGDTQAPTTPTALTASNTTQTTTDLSWNASSDNVGVTGYNVYIDGNLDGTTSNTNYSITGLTASTTYSMSVEAFDAAGNISGQASTNVTTNAPNPGGTTVLSAHYFETGWDGWIDGGSDCYRYNGSRSWEGNKSIRIRDNSGTASSMTSPTYNLGSYDAVEVNFYFYPNSMEYNEDFWLRYYNGSSWTTVAAYARGVQFNNNTFYVATVTLSSNDYNMASNAKFRFQCDASGNADRIYIDAVTISGINNSTFMPTKSGQTIAALGNNELLETDAINIEDDIQVYPNPVKDELTILINEDKAQAISIYNLNGQMVKFSDNVEVENSMDVSNLASGLYFISVRTDDEVLTSKFFKK